MEVKYITFLPEMFEIVSGAQEVSALIQASEKYVMEARRGYREEKW